MPFSEGPRCANGIGTKACTRGDGGRKDRQGPVNVGSQRFSRRAWRGKDRPPAGGIEGLVLDGVEKRTNISLLDV